LEKSEKRDTKTEEKKHGHQGRVRESKQKARRTVNLTGGQSDYVAPSNPLERSRATVDLSSSSVLPTFPEWSPRKSGWSPGSPVQTPRGKPSVQREKLTLGRGRTRDVQEIIRELVGTVKDASVEQIEKARGQLEIVKGSGINLGQVVQGYESNAEATRREIDSLRQRATNMEEQAAVLQKLREGGTAQCEVAISALDAELERRAESVEHGRVEVAKTSFQEDLFGEATLSLDDLLEILTPAYEKLEAQAREMQRADSVRNVLPTEPIAEIEKGTVSPVKIERKRAEHAERVERLKTLLAEEEAKLKKWEGKASSTNL
jgi:hypothetical protein